MESLLVRFSKSIKNWTIPRRVRCSLVLSLSVARYPRDTRRKEISGRSRLPSLYTLGKFIHRIIQIERRTRERYYGFVVIGGSTKPRVDANHRRSVSKVIPARRSPRCPCLSPVRRDHYRDRRLSKNRKISRLDPRKSGSGRGSNPSYPRAGSPVDRPLVYDPWNRTYLLFPLCASLCPLENRRRSREYLRYRDNTAVRPQKGAE